MIRPREVRISVNPIQDPVFDEVPHRYQDGYFKANFSPALDGGKPSQVNWAQEATKFYQGTTFRTGKGEIVVVGPLLDVIEPIANFKFNSILDLRNHRIKSS